MKKLVSALGSVDAPSVAFKSEETKTIVGVTRRRTEFSGSNAP